MPIRVQDKDRGWRKLQHAVARASSASVAVGVIGDGKGGEQHEGGMTNAELAAIHEYGVASKGIPERSFIRSTFDSKRAAWEKLSGDCAKLVLAGTMTVERALGLLGARASADIKNAITQGAGISPALKPETIRRKGSDRPLVDTGRLVGAITWAVRKGGE